MKILIGLGNPGAKYCFHRHNVGRLFVDFLQKRWQFENFKTNKKAKAEVSEGFFQGTDILLAKPLVFMNESGESVLRLLKYYCLDLTDLIIIHDESDLYFSQFKISQNKNAAGHHGIESIFRLLKNKNITRVRIGIRPLALKKAKAEEFVLTDFSAKEKKALESIFTEIAGRLEKEIIKTGK